ncbi:MAG: sulfotransferase domain-containing protein [Hyphomonadaceae bacterium]|nr:sulfotransferase domain-containing protein [Hyphomonadaceae bacterium]
MPKIESIVTSSESRSIAAKPDILVIGAMRAGTTTLHELLRLNPMISVPAIKETDFFSSARSETPGGWDWYARQFDADKPIWCDISPRYAKRDLAPDAAKQIAATNPDARIIFIARDPVKRAMSQYAHSFHMGHDMPSPSDLLGSVEGAHIVSTSRYAFNLEPYLEHFEGRIEILDFARLQADPKLFLRDFFQAANIDGDVADIAAVARNTSDQLARQPKWWGKLRESRIGETLRTRIPRAHIVRVKRLLARKWNRRTMREAPPFSDDDKARLSDVLAEDAARFRTMFGHDFADWCL